MDDVFLQAVFTEPPRIMDFDLRPFSPGHYLTLEQLGSPFLCGGERSARDVFIALFFCSRTFKECRAAIADDGLPKIFERLGQRRVRVWPRAGILTDPPHRTGRLTRRERYSNNEVVAQIDDYIDSYMRVPEHWEMKNAHKIKTPSLYAATVGVVIATKGAISIDDAWDMGMSTLACITTCAGDIAGSKSYITPGEEVGRLVARGDIAPEDIPGEQIATFGPAGSNGGG